MIEETAIDYFAEENNPVEEAPAATLESLVNLASTVIDLDKQIVEAQIALGELEDKRKKIARTQIPDIMDELGMQSFKLADGSTLDVKTSINASISEDNKPAAFAWLTEHEKDGIIKTKVTSEFGKGEIEAAREAVKALTEAGFGAMLDQSVHPMTLKSFVKEQLEEGVNIPLEVFGVFEFKEAKITPPKAPRKRK